MIGNEILWRPLDPDVVAHPYEYYQLLREEHPVFQSQTGEWIISGYEEIKSILSDKQKFHVGNRLEWMNHAASYANKKQLDYSAIPRSLQSFILFKNPPEHSESRKWVHKHWNNNISNNSLIQELVGNRKDQFDFVEEIAKPLPLFSIAKVLGIPEKDALQLKTWSYEVIRVMDLYLTFKDLEQINSASIQLHNYFLEKVKDPRALDQDGIIYKLLNDNSNSMSNDEMASAFIFLFIAGQETTSALLSTMLMHIARNNLFDEIRSHESMDQVVHEFLRFDPPVQLLGRIAMEDVNVGGTNIPTGSTLTLCVGGANRDPKVFEHPNEILFTRTDNPYLSFGYGIHRCLGETMAIQIAKEFLAYLVSNVKSILLPVEQLKWDRHVSVRRLTSLTIQFDA